MSITIPHTFNDGNLIVASQFNDNFASLDNRTQWVTPEMFGAVGDGVTNDYSSIMAALATGKKLLLTAIYGVSSQITLSDQVLSHIEGTNFMTTGFKAISAMNAILYKSANNNSSGGVVAGSTFKNFILDCNSLADYGLDFARYKQTEIGRIYAQNPKKSYFRLGYGTDLTYETHMHDCWGYVTTGSVLPANRPDYGIQLGGYATDSFFTNIVIANVKTAGIQMQGGGNVISGYHVFGFPEPDYRPEYGIVDTHGYNSYSQCYFDSVNTAGIKISSDKITLANSVYYLATANSAFYGVEIDSGKRHLVIIGNDFGNITGGNEIRFLGTVGDRIEILANTPNYGTYGNYSTTSPRQMVQTNSAYSGVYDILSALTSKYSQTKYQTSGVDRWNIGKNNAAEAGSNAGSNFTIERRDDAGNSLGTALEINRATGAISIENVITLVGITGASAPNNSIYKDASTGKLYFKDNSGVSNALY